MDTLRSRARARTAELPARLQTIDTSAESYEVVLSERLRDRYESTREKLEEAMT